MRSRRKRTFVRRWKYLEEKEKDERKETRREMMEIFRKERGGGEGSRGGKI